MRICFVVWLILLAALVLLNAPRANADVAPDPEAAASDISPGQGTQVQMVSERVVLDVQMQPLVRASDTFTATVALVTADFTMRNLGSMDETMDVRFPKSFASADASFPIQTAPAVETIETFVNGEPVANRSVNDKGAPWAVWRVDFPAGREVKLRVQYRTIGVDYYGSVDFYYILETGAGWRGPIGQGDIIFQFPYAANVDMVEPHDEYIRALYPSATPPFIPEGNQLRWHFENLEPTRTDNVRLQIVRPDLWQAILDAHERMERNPKDASAQIQLGQALRDAIPIKNWWPQNSTFAERFGARADAAFRRATELVPNDAAAHLAYAQFLSDRAWSQTPEPYYSAARRELARAVELAPNAREAALIAQQLDLLAKIPEIARQLNSSGENMTPTPKPTRTASSKRDFQLELIDDYCRQGQCLFTDRSGNLVLGLATLEGYFMRVTRPDWGETKVCDSFIVTGGAQTLIDYYLSQIEESNTVNSKTVLNQPIISLDLSGLSGAEKQKLLASNSKQPVSLRVLSFLPPKPTSAGACYAPVQILQVLHANGAPAIPLQQLGFKGTTLWTEYNNQDHAVYLTYPGNWYFDPNSDGAHILVQNVSPFDDPSNVPGGLPEGFARFTFNIETQATPTAPRGEQATINDVIWYRRVMSGGAAGDRTVMLETVYNGLVYRIQNYISGTGGKGPLFEYQATILDSMVSSFRIQQ